MLNPLFDAGLRNRFVVLLLSAIIVGVGVGVGVDRQALARYGVPAEGAMDAVKAAGGIPAGEIIVPGRRFPLVAKVPQEYRDGPAALGKVLFTTPTGQLRPLPMLARLEKSAGPSSIQRDRGRRRVVIQANVRVRDIGSFVEEAGRRVADRVKLPSGYTMDWGGQFENMARAERRLYEAISASAISRIVGRENWKHVAPALRQSPDSRQT